MRPIPIAYLTGDIIFLIIWSVLFFLRKDLRKKMLTMSFLIAPLGPLSEFFYLRDYWKPELLFGLKIGIEDIIFAFTIGGITGVIYEELLGKRYVRRHLPSHRHWMFAFSFLGLIWMLLGNIFFGWNSIYVSIAGFFVIGILILVLRHDLAQDAFLSGLLMGCLMFGFYIVFLIFFPGVIQRWWLLKNISGILVFGVPLEELLWGFSWGMIAGPAYEFVTGLRFNK